MADGAAEAAATIATEAVADAAVKAGETVAAVVANAETQIANAEHRVEAAQAVAQAVTDAAMQNEVVRKAAEAAETVEGLDEWEEEIETRIAALQSQVSSLETILTELRAEMTELKKPVTVVTTQTEASSILPNSEAPPAEAVTVTTVTPGENPEVTQEKVVVPGKPKRQWI